MIRWIIRSSIRLRLVVIAIAILLLFFGITQLRKTPVDILPEFSRPYVEVQIEALGLSAQEVEAMITTPLEADMLNGTPWAEEIRSVSLPGLASIMLVFEKGTDIMRARQVAQERLIELFALPNVSNQFTMINPVSSTNRCLGIGLSSETISLIDMSVLARWTIAPHLMGLHGVANVSIWGERQRQLQVQVDPERLRKEGITLMQIIKTTGNSLWSSPLSFLEASTPGTGGWIDTPNQRLGIRHILPIKTAEDLSKVPVEGQPHKRLGDVTTVVEGHQPLIGDAIVNEASSLMLVVEKFPWANTKEVTAEVEKALAILQPGLTGITMDTTHFRPATFIDLVVNNLSVVLMIGLLLIVFSFIAFLLNWRTALIGISAIVLSLITAGSILYISGITLNMMIIAGFMVALAVIISSVVIDTENIIRCLHQNQEAEDKKSTIRVIYEAFLETRSPIIYAVLIMILALIPVIFMEGISGAIWQPVVTTYILALVASLLVSLTLTPVLSIYLLQNPPPAVRYSPLAGFFKKVHQLLFGWVTKKPQIAFAVTCILLVIGLFSARYLRQESLLPEFKATDLVVRWEGSAVISHKAMSRISAQVTSELRTIPGVRNVSADLGRAIVSDRHTNINAGEILVSIDPDADYEQTRAAVSRVVAGYPNLSSDVLTYLDVKIRKELTGTQELMVVRVYGEDLNIIEDKAKEVKTILAGIEGIKDPRVQKVPEMPSLEIEVDIDIARQYNLKPGDVRRAATSLVSGIVAGSLFEEQKVFNVVVWGTPETRQSVTAVENILVDTPAGGQVRLKELADIRIVPSVTEIHRDAVSRYIDVTANVSGRDIGLVGDDIEDRLRSIQFPLEYRAELLGEYAEQDAAKDRILAFIIAAAIGILLLLQANFRSWQLSVVVFLTIPIALIGGVVTILFYSGGLFSFGSILGFITVLGVVVFNVMAMIHRYRKSETQNGDKFNHDLVIESTREQCLPVLMISVTTALAFLPILFLGNIAGLEILFPMSLTVLGGLVTVILYTMIGVPAIYLLFGKAREPEIELSPVVLTSADNIYLDS